MSVVASLLAVSLSLNSASDYVYLRIPQGADIQGAGLYGDALRLEDAAFIEEALEHRWAFPSGISSVKSVTTNIVDVFVSKYGNVMTNCLYLASLANFPQGNDLPSWDRGPAWTDSREFVLRVTRGSPDLASNHYVSTSIAYGAPLVKSELQKVYNGIQNTKHWFKVTDRNPTSHIHSTLDNELYTHLMPRYFDTTTHQFVYAQGYQESMTNDVYDTAFSLLCTHKATCKKTYSLARYKGDEDNWVEVEQQNGESILTEIYDSTASGAKATIIASCTNTVESMTATVWGLGWVDDYDSVESSSYKEFLFPIEAAFNGYSGEYAVFSISVSTDDLKSAAKKATGIEDFHDPDILESIDRPTKPSWSTEEQTTAYKTNERVKEYRVGVSVLFIVIEPIFKARTL